MSRGGSYGGGKSSLSYLFEPEETNETSPNSSAKHAKKSQAKNHEKSDEGNQTGTPASKSGEKPQMKEDSKKQVVQEGNKPQKQAASGAVNFYTGRPSTKVNSVPGGRSSLGYLFGDS